VFRYLQALWIPPGICKYLWLSAAKLDIYRYRLALQFFFHDRHRSMQRAVSKIIILSDRSMDLQMTRRSTWPLENTVYDSTFLWPMLLWMLLRLVDWLISRGQKARIYTDLSPIFTAIFVSISLIHLHIRLHWYEPLCTDMSRSPEASLHTPTAYQTDLSSEAHDAGTDATAKCQWNQEWYVVFYRAICWGC